MTRHLLLPGPGLRIACSRIDWQRATPVFEDVTCDRCQRTPRYKAAVIAREKILGNPDQDGRPAPRKNILKRFLTV